MALAQSQESEADSNSRNVVIIIIVIISVKVMIMMDKVAARHVVPGGKVRNAAPCASVLPESHAKVVGSRGLRCRPDHGFRLSQLGNAGVVGPRV